MSSYLASNWPLVMALAMFNIVGLYILFASGSWLICLASIASIDLILLWTLMPARPPSPHRASTAETGAQRLRRLTSPQPPQPPATGANRLDPSLVLVERVAPDRGGSPGQDWLTPVLVLPEPAPARLKDKSATDLRAEVEELLRRLEQRQRATDA